ncbi:MAG TPA: biopolymer transporter ExbD [Bacteriovoracaceae bacterium]|nr:biopolymer transporter ExbD [Bacteriovoracaceae bacterium]
MARRASRFHRRSKNQVFDVDITSLLDILTILLVFLLQSYNSSGVTINVPKGIELPRSASETLNTFGVNIQVSKSQIWVDDTEVVNTDNTDNQNMFDEGGRRIVPLYNELVKIKETIKQSEKLSPQVKPFSGVANLVVEKSLKYSYLKRVMYTCAAAGFKEFKFVVLTKTGN